MPIVVRPEESSPLAQGDILRGVPFALTGKDNLLIADRSVSYVLIMSRPCKALRDDVVVVAPIVAYPLEIAEGQKPDSPAGGLDKVRRVLAAQRDGIRGGNFSDALYLGTLDANSTRRYAAQLTTLSTVQVPQEPSQRHQWILERRAWRLSGDFVRDLHTRLILTFTRLGFEDDSWYSDADLDIMINTGEGELVHHQGQLLLAQQAVQRDEALNKTVSKQQYQALEVKKSAVADAEAKVKPYQDEREKRSGTKVPPT